MPDSQDSSSLNVVKQLTETLSGFAQWIAELVRGKNWFTLLLLIDASLILFGRLVANFLWNLLGSDLPEKFNSWLWIAVGIIFVAAVVVAVVTMPKVQPEQTDFRERKAIKGLRSFTREDAEVFAKLQRGRMLKECLETLSYKDFRFGVLVGESGCGKSSFLQAGLWHRLSQEDSEMFGIYVRFSDRDALETVREALVEQLEFDADSVKDDDFLALMQKAAAQVGKPLILFFDQFEQFFVHRKQKTERESLLTGLQDWFSHFKSLDIKILFGIRSDLYNNMIEIQQALNYSPSPQEIFQLRKFTPQEATKILSEIAKVEGLSFEESFIEEVAASELASREDGLISPVDLQILAWMIEKQNADELRAFNRVAFQKFGGIEGLLTRFLERTLDARVTSGQRQAALKVLLALTDLERGVRGNVLTIQDLQEKLKDAATVAEVRESAEWLARGDVRLITAVKNKSDQMGYELAHEKIIPALRGVAGKELSEVDRANQLLDRRVNEWLGNQRNVRYLLNLREIWFVERHKTLVTWGVNEAQKKQLLKLSKQRFARIGQAVGALLLVGLSVWVWLISPMGQLWWMKRRLVALSIGQGIKPETAALVFAKNGDADQAKSAIEKIQYDNSKSWALRQIAEAYIQLNDEVKAKELLSSALSSADKIQNNNSKSWVLMPIVEAANKLKDEVKAKELLSSALSSADKIQNDNSKSLILRAITKVYIQLKDEATAKELLNAALSSADKLQSDDDKSEALIAITKIASTLKNEITAKELLNSALSYADKLQLDDDKSEALIAIAEVYIQLNDETTAKELLNAALSSANKFQSDDDKSEALIAITKIASTLKDETKAKELLNAALSSADKLQSDYSKSEALEEIAEVYIQLKDEATARVLLNTALSSAERIQDDFQQSQALRAIAEVYIQLKDEATAKELLDTALSSADRIQGDSSKSLTLRAIAEVYIQLKDEATAKELLSTALSSTDRIQSETPKTQVLKAIAEAVSKLKDETTAKKLLSSALSSADQIQDESSKSWVLRAIAEAVSKLKDETTAKELLSSALSSADQIQDESSKSLILWAIAEAASKLKDETTAKELLSSALFSADQIQNDSSKSSTLRTISKAASKLKAKNQAELMEEIFEATKGIQSDDHKMFVLKMVSRFYAEQKNWRKAHQKADICSAKTCHVEVLSEILTVKAEQDHPELIERDNVSDAERYD